MRIFLIVVFVFSLSFSFEITEFDRIQIDSVFKNCPRSNYNRLVSKSPRTYIAFTSLDMNYDINTIVSFLLDEKNQSHMFHWFNKFERINKIDSTWYYEIVYGPFGYWALLDLKKSFQNDSICEFVLTQNHDNYLNEVNRKKCKRLYVSENHDQILKWKLEKKGVKKTRVGFYSLSVPTMFIPNWLYKLSINTILPESLEDLDKNIKKNEERTRPIKEYVPD